MDLATILLLSKSSFIVGTICFAYIRWRSKEPGLECLAIGYGLLAFASTIAGMGEQRLLPFTMWTFGSFAIGITGYALTAMGILRLSYRGRNKIYWLISFVAIALSVVIGAANWYADNEMRAAIFNSAAAGFLTLACIQLLRDFPKDRLPARYCLLASLSSVIIFCFLIVEAMMLPQYAAMDPGDAFFMLIICHFSLSLFVVVLVQERSEAKLKRLANTDALTGIPNRQHFIGGLPQNVRAGDAFIMVDIDHFKNINDSYGHEVGDDVLVGVAQEIARIAGEEIAFGRLGGEEFGLYVPSSSPSAALSIASKICHGVAALSLGHAGKRITTSASVGVAVSYGHLAAKTLRDQADQALYRAKSFGRNRVEIYDCPPVHSL
ncbi:GGDEF domain-containing protein [Rhizobium sp. NPDC090275]|uniref:GGDEF domain-containing protein n=1 Tax=Rhizobium sp. NPDC090275 TaxID=3364498 RepID=UPI00383AFE42